jgi:hypothetical protein
VQTAGIVAFAFGVPDTIRSNQQIAHIASQKARELNAPIYTQLDVRVEQGIDVTYTDEEPGDPPPTLIIARGAVQWARERGFTALWVVAAKPHLWRALRDLEQAVHETGETITVCSCKEIEQYAEQSWFCPDSIQARVRSRQIWERREGLIKLMPFAVYERLTK